MGCAKDIVEYVGVPRFLFSDFPLGNPAGRPNDRESQEVTLELALRVLISAPAPRTTVQSPRRWSDDPAWKLDFSNIARLSPEEIARRRAEFDRQKEIAKTIRENRKAAVSPPKITAESKRMAGEPRPSRFWACRADQPWLACQWVLRRTR